MAGKGEALSKWLMKKGGEGLKMADKAGAKFVRSNGKSAVPAAAAALAGFAGGKMMADDGDDEEPDNDIDDKKKKKKKRPYLED